MYYPILRGKQHEFSVLKDLAQQNSYDNFRPIIEPVKKNLTNLLKTIKALNEKNIEPVLIINPTIGDFKGRPSEFLNLLNAHQTNIKYLPCINMNIEGANSLINGLTKFGLYFDEFFTPSDLTNTPEIILVPHTTPIDSLSSLNNIVLYGDFFPVQRKNADYPSQSFITDLNINFSRTPNVIGYSDYTITSKKYSDKGGPAYVVAIHATYINNSDNKKYSKHYLSFDDKTMRNVAGKFHDALKKLITDVDQQKFNYYPTSALKDFRFYHDKPHYPGLGINKQISIKHHIETINHFLKSA